MFSGPIIKDKLWFHFNTESHILQTARTPDLEGYFPTPETYRKFIQKGTLKLTWQVTSRNKLQSLTNFDSPHEWNQRGTSASRPTPQRIRHGFRFMQGLIWESLLSDSLVLRSQVAFMIPIPEHIYPRLCATRPVECDHIPAVRNTFPRTQDFGNDREHRRHFTFSVQFQNRLDWFLSSKALGEHSLSLRDNFYAEQDSRKFSRPGDLYYELNGTTPEALTTYYSNDPRIEPARYGWYHPVEHRGPPHRDDQRHLEAHPLPDHHPGSLARLGERRQQRGQRRWWARRPSPRRCRWPGTPPTTAAPRCAPATTTTSTSTSSICPATPWAVRSQQRCLLERRQHRLLAATVNTAAAPATPSACPAGLWASTPAAIPAART